MIRLVADQRIHPYLVRAYDGNRLKAYAVLDQFGWAIMANRLNRQGRPTLQTIDRYDLLWPEEPIKETTRAALIGLVRFAGTGSTGETYEDDELA